MSTSSPDFWTDQTSVLFTSFWGWSPEIWGTVGFTGHRGLARRNNLLKELTNPFITVVYVTSNKTYADSGLKGKIAGFYLVSHEIGDRNQFVHPSRHAFETDKWRHSLRAIRAFSYLPEYRLSVPDLDPLLVGKGKARHVSAMGELLTNAQQIELLRTTPWVEVACYQSAAHVAKLPGTVPGNGFVAAGPLNKGGYYVSGNTDELKLELYVLRLIGDTGAYLGHSANGRSIFKIGLSISPDSRRLAFQNSMPRGAFLWSLHRTNKLANIDSYSSFDAAVAGEYAIKKHLAGCAEWLGGEFYLAAEAQIDEAWQLGHSAAQAFGKAT
jgi:hypothetical protein